MISDASSVIGLQQEIQRSEESRYDHRLHGVLLVAQGMTCPEVARLLGDAPRSVEYWVHRFEEQGGPYAPSYLSAGTLTRREEHIQSFADAGK